MADTKTKIIKLKVELDDRGLVKYVSEIKEAGRATDDLGKRGGLRQLNQDLGAIATKAAIGVAALTGFFKGADALSQVGQSALRSRASLDALTDSTADYEQKVRAVQAATRGLTTESEAAAIAARLQQFGLAETAGEMQAFVDTIVRVGAVNPMLGDTTEAINQIQLTLSNMSFMRLDQLGLSAGKVRARMEQLQKSSQKMTREVAFQQAVMEGLAQQAERVDDAMLEIGRNQGYVKAQLRGLRDEIGINLNTALEAAATSAIQLWEIIQQLGAQETVVRVTAEVTESEEFAQFFVDIANTASGVVGGPQLGSVTTVAGRRAGSMTPQRAETVMGLALDQILNPFGSVAGIPASTMDLSAFYQRQRATNLSGTTMAGLDPALQGVYINPATVAGRDREQAAVIAQQHQQRLPTTGAGFEFMQAAQTGLGLARGELDEFGQTQLPGIVAGIQELAGSFADAAGAAGDFVTEAEAVGNLNEFFGVAPSGLDADIYTRAADALRNASVEGDAYAEALRILGIETGVTNVANEVFNDQLNNLATALANGEITAAQYVEQIRLLQNTDWSKMQAFATSMDPEQAAEFATALGAVGGTEAFDTAYTKIGDIIGLIKGDEDGGEGVNVFQGMMDDSTDMAEAIIVNAGDASREAEAAFTQLSSTGQQTFIDLSGVAEEEFDKIHQGLASFNGSVVTMTVTVTAPGIGDTVTVGGSSAATPGGSSMPEFASGGHTGAGTGAFLAWLHEDEWVVNQDMRRSLARGGGIQGAQMTTAGLQQGRLEADTPIVIQIGEDELARVNARHAYRTNARGAVPSNG